MTVVEIARLAGVSIGTVDRVLHNRGRVSKATKAKIEAIIKKHNFTPNPIAKQLKRNRPYRFSALIPRRDQDAGYWGQIIEGIERAAGEISPLGAETKRVEFDRYNPASLEKAFKSINAGKPEGLLIAPIMPERIKPFIEVLCEKKIPFVFIDTDMPEITPLCVIAQNPFSGGYLAGKLFHLFAGNTGSFAVSTPMPAAVLNVHSQDYNITRRRDGFLSYTKENNLPVIVQEYSDYESSEISVEEIERFLKKYPHLSGIFISNSMAHRVVEAVGRKEKKQHFLIVGYDLIPDNRRLLHEGCIDAIISQRPEEQGREALLTLFRSVVLGQEVENRREIPLDVYIRENTPA
jgi:LacI family transcriptional regulator